MFKNYLTTAWRSLLKNKASSFINVSGLSIGMAVAMLIGLWIWDEFSFNKSHQNYKQIAQVMENRLINGNIETGGTIPWPLEAEVHKSFGSDFKYIVMSSFTEPHILNVGERNISYQGNFIGAEAPEMLGMKMIQGSLNALREPSSMLLSRSVAIALFGDGDALNNIVKLDNRADFKVSGIYEDFPGNSSFHDISFMAPWDFFAGSADWIGRDPNNWNDNSLFMYVQVADHADMTRVSDKIKNIKLTHINPGEAASRPLLFLQPMSKWHLYAEFKNGVNAGGAIEYVWLFGIIGLFVLLLACINFMNLSTARSEKRSKEVGIRKAIGSLKIQLVYQFFCESLLIALLAFVFSLLQVWITLPFFNEVASKNISILWSNPQFWLLCLCFTVFTGLLAGTYPAFYLSSFRPVKVLKGVFKAGPYAAIPRKVLVVLQFTVSVILIIGTIIVFKQVQFSKNRPVGYSRDGLIAIETPTDELHRNFQAFRSELLRSGGITEVAESSSSATGINNYRNDVLWKGKDPTIAGDFASISVSTEFGKTVGWQFVTGRDFSVKFMTDSSAVVLNEAAVKYMGLTDPVGQVITFGNRNRIVIGVIKDMVMQSPYEPVKQTVFYIGRRGFDYVNIRINPVLSTHDALTKIEAVYKAYSPAVPFAYKFADEEYAKKFNSEERIGKLSGFFSILAVFISCLGLFGMASYMVEQRSKEISVRKVLGATVFSLWHLLSKDFVQLIMISLLIAIPVAYYFMYNWLQGYRFRTELSWWIFASAGAGAMLVTLLTVSVQAIRAAIVKPAKSLMSE